MSGPRPTPTPILKARGSWLVNNRKQEPAAQGKLTPIIRLSKAAKRIWDFTVCELDKMGVGKTADSGALLRYAKLFAFWLDACERLEKSKSLTYSTINKRGAEFVQLNPLIKVVASLNQQLIRLEEQYGLTPSARSRIQIEALPEVPQAKARFFKENTG